jgi:hypothetical protein
MTPRNRDTHRRDRPIAYGAQRESATSRLRTMKQSEAWAGCHFEQEFCQYGLGDGVSIASSA